MIFSEYKELIEEEYGECQILHAERNHSKKTSCKTSDRNAPKGFSWIDYWRAMTCNHAKTMKCISCGKIIFVGEPIDEQMKEFSKGKDTVEKHRVHGGHISVSSPADKNFVCGRYITPLCPEYNGQHGKEINIKKDSIYCKELGALVD